MPAPPSHSSNRISIEYQRHLEQTPGEFQMLIRDDRYALHLPLSAGRSRFTSDGKLLHDGRVLPGMMRLASPGEEVQGVVYTPMEAIVLHIPGPHLRARLEEFSPNHKRGEVCFVTAMLKPRAQVQQLDRLLARTHQQDPNRSSSPRGKARRRGFYDGGEVGPRALLAHGDVAPAQERSRKREERRRAPSLVFVFHPIQGRRGHGQRGAPRPGSAWRPRPGR